MGNLRSESKDGGEGQRNSRLLLLTSVFQGQSNLIGREAHMLIYAQRERQRFQYQSTKFQPVER